MTDFDWLTDFDCLYKHLVTSTINLPYAYLKQFTNDADQGLKHATENSQQAFINTTT